MLSNDDVTLRPYCAADLPALFDLRNDLEVQKALLVQPTPNTHTQVEHWIQRRSAASDGAFFVIAETSSNRTLGFLQFTSIHPLHGTCYSGIAIGHHHRGRGVHARAYALAEPYLREVHKVRKIKVEVVASNDSSLRAFDRIGFQRVGLLRRELYCDGRYQDLVVLEKFIETSENGSQ